MFKSARWWSEKNKVKVVFKLQFHASQVTQVEGDALMIAVVPADTGKPTVKSDKATVRDGNCFWENPVYETVKFNQDPKSGKIHERIYYFVVGTGSSKAGVVGEASIDFSNYAEATKVSLVSLPLKNSNTEAVLHVSIQRIQESMDQREVEESRNAKLYTEDHSLRSHLSNNDIDGTIRSNSVEDASLNQTVSHATELNTNHRASSGSDVTISSSESSFGIETPRELQMKNDNIHQEEAAGYLSSLRPQGPESGVPTPIQEENHRSQWEWLRNSALEGSTDDSSSTPRETFLRQHSEEAPDIAIEKLKSDLTALSRQAELSELELQTLRKQIVKESKRGQDLGREIFCLKEERDALKGECEELKAFQRRMDAKTKNNLHFEGADSRVIVKELRQELNHAKELNANLRIQLQKTQESNSELILAVRDLDEMLEQKNREISIPSSRSLENDMDEKSQEAGSTCETDDYNDDEEQNALEELVKEHSDAKEAYLLEQKIMDMRSELQIYKRDKDGLEMQLEQLALDYEIMKQENHDMAYKLEQSQIQEQLKMQYECSSSYSTAHELEAQMEHLENELERRSKESSVSLVRICELEAQTENLENELKRRSKESSDSLLRISELEAHVKSLEEELQKQAQGFEADLEALTLSKVEQEQRAIGAEETLRKMRWKNANTAERLQVEFRTLSVQMASTFEANEKLATKALAEANELRLQKSHLEEMLQKTFEEHQSVKDNYETRLHQRTNQVISMTNQIEQMQSEIENRALQLEHQKKHAEETQRLLSDEIVMLRDEIEIHVAKNKILLEDMGSKKRLVHELEQMRLSIKEMELLVEQGNDERIELESAFKLRKNDAEESPKELDKMRCLVKEKEFIVGNLHSELDFLQAQCTVLKNSLLEDELEKEKLRKQVFQLRSDLKKREDAFNSMEKKIKDGNGRGTTLDIVKAKTSKPLPRGSKEIVNLKERIKLLEGEIKLKEADMETSANSFLEKEKDLCNKIEALEGRLEVLNENSAHFCENEVQKLAAVKEDQDCISSDEARNSDENLNIMSNDLSEDLKDSSYHTELINEMALLKERNKSMEGELKEMQERYSGISLKFAEVEGERQQLVMSLRNLKNANKSP